MSNKSHIMCILFDKCNLNCKFCFEANKSRTIDIDYIKAIPNGIRKIRDERFPQATQCDLTLMGGEMFSDTLPDSMFEVYSNLVSELRKLPNLSFNINALTNGVFKKHHRVRDFLQSNDVSISFSYDPVDRYPSEVQLNMFKDSVVEFADLTTTILITPTKRSINAIVEGRSDLKFLSTHCKHLDLSFYIPGINYQELNPSDDDLYTLFRYLIDNQYFHFKDIREILKPFLPQWQNFHTVFLTCNCDRLVTYSKNNITSVCVKINSPLPIVRFYGKHSNKVNEHTVNVYRKQRGMEKRGCLQCEYCDQCVMPCWTSILFDEYQLSQCPYKRLIEYITENRDTIVEQYKQWEHENV